LIAGNTRQGVCDMAGNVFEWTLDAWHNSYVGAPTDGSAWDGSNKVVRGGNFLSGPWTSAQRGVYFGASYLNTFIGFRCVR
jgi:formylglycine-generating enzyme required for sulfatase activity